MLRKLFRWHFEDAAELELRIQQEKQLLAMNFIEELKAKPRIQ